ncbi:hypothetical protein [Pyrobaculum aerophilum]|uniref:hypothetical protein n=1 Tax=Pyrobaculum aerophilum TaxID=13773 RepID=UPI0011C06843|nr:hypothetical protein [Pyrobaculum aerophilum]
MQVNSRPSDVVAGGELGSWTSWRLRRSRRGAGYGACREGFSVVLHIAYLRPEELGSSRA